MNDPLLELKEAGMRFGDKVVLEGVTQTIDADSLVVLHGPNGGGKTTLLRMMAGLLRPTSGHLARRERLSVGYLPQVRHIDRQFPITVSQVVLTGLLGGKPLWRPYTPGQRRLAAEQMERLHLSGLAGRSIRELSGGQWQRTLLARALVAKPQLLLLDEPDTHLDTATRELLYGILAQEAGRCAIVIVSHDAAIGTAFPAARTWEVSQGRVTETPERKE